MRTTAFVITQKVNQVKQKFRTWDVSNTMVNSMSQHHLYCFVDRRKVKGTWIICQGLKEPGAIVSEFSFQIQCLTCFAILVLLTFGSGSFFVMGLSCAL